MLTQGLTGGGGGGSSASTALTGTVTKTIKNTGGDFATWAEFAAWFEAQKWNNGKLQLYLETGSSFTVDAEINFFAPGLRSIVVDKTESGDDPVLSASANVSGEVFSIHPMTPVDWDDIEFVDATDGENILFYLYPNAVLEFTGIKTTGFEQISYADFGSNFYARGVEFIGPTTGLVDPMFELRDMCTLKLSDLTIDGVSANGDDLPAIEITGNFVDVYLTENIVLDDMDYFVLIGDWNHASSGVGCRVVVNDDSYEDITATNVTELYAYYGFDDDYHPLAYNTPTPMGQSVVYRRLDGSPILRAAPNGDDGAQEHTIASGVVTWLRDSSLVKVDTESDGASDDLDTITGGEEGDIIKVIAANDARTVVLKHGTGNIYNGNGGDADITLDSVRKIAELYHNGSEWIAA